MRSKDDVQEFRERVLERARLRKDPQFEKYVCSVTPKAWAHFLERGSLSAEEAEKTFWSFFLEDRRNASPTD